MLPEQYEKDQQRLDLLDCLLENSMEAFFCINSQWRILAINRQAESLCQKARTELLGRTVWDALPTVATSLFSLRAQEALQQHKSREYTAFSSALDAWFAMRLYPTHTGLAVFVQEITERKRAEEEKQDNDSPAQAILDSMDVMMALLDPDGTICVVNEAWRRRAQAFCTADQLERTGIGMNYLEVCRQARGACSEEAPEALAGIQAVLQGTQPSFTMEYPCFSATQHNWYLMSVTPLPQNRGAVTAHIDITERILLDQQKDTFIGMASHELRTPLTALKMLARRAKKKWAEGMRDPLLDLTKMETQIDRLTKLVAELMDVSKIQAGTFDYDEEMIDLDALLDEVVETTQQMNSGHRLIIHGASHAMITGDRSKLSQVFTNLLSNAIKYSPQANTVDIYLETSHDVALVSVHDDGIGISGEHLGSIFERFYRINTTRSNHVPGLGMGLYIAYEIVKQHRGNITVTSEEGKGSTFSVSLPLSRIGTSTGQSE
jgi:PAS domain S-box-containing protein